MVKIVDKDIFTVDNSYILCHCISADWPRGYAGIAYRFEKQFHFDEELNKLYPNPEFSFGDCIITNCSGRAIANLITKSRYYEKPINKDMFSALTELKYECEEQGIKKVAMPYLIGCGLDRLQEDDVLAMIHKVFDDSDIEILICKYQR